MRTRSSDRQAGFALIESIAVLALSALVFVTLLIATDLVSRNSAAAARRTNILETLATGLAAVRRDLEGTRFIRIGPREEDPLLFSGGRQAVAVAVADDGTGFGEGESLVLIETRYSEGIGALIRSSAQLRPGTSGFGGVEFGNSALLVSGPWRFQFSYADFESMERWQGTWTARGRLPGAIRVEVLGPGGARVLPPLVVRVAVNSGGCADAARTDCASEDAAREIAEENPEEDPGGGDGTGDDSGQ